MRCTCTTAAPRGTRLWAFVRVTPRACARGCLSVVVTKIARSLVLGICACCNYHGLVDISENWSLCASNCWIWLTSATNSALIFRSACRWFTDRTHSTCWSNSTAHAHLDAGKDRRVMKWILRELECFNAMLQWLKSAWTKQWSTIIFDSTYYKFHWMQVSDSVRKNSWNSI